MEIDYDLFLIDANNNAKNVFQGTYKACKLYVEAMKQNSLAFKAVIVEHFTLSAQVIF